MTKSFRILLALIMIATVAYRAAVDCKANVEKPNFIFILVDDLGKEWISGYGAKEVITPNIDRMADEGIKFNKAYSMPQCTPSRVALITGQYPYNNGWINHYDVPRWGHGAKYDPDLNPSFVKVLKNNGYKTCVAGKWQINDFRLEPEAMINSGFEEYCMWTGSEGGNEKVSGKRYWDPYIHTREGSKTYKGQFGPDIFSDFIVEFMRKNREHPMCIYYPMVLTHSPFVPTPHEPNASSTYEKHCAMVRYTDYIVGKLRKSVQELKIEDNTYIIFTTDNGTSGSIIGKRDNVYIKGGKTYLSENGINSPFIVTSPAIQKGVETDALIDFTDIYPTLLELAGVTETEECSIDGISFADVLTGKNFYGSRSWAVSLGGLPARINDEGKVANILQFRDRIIMGEKYKVYVDTSRQINRIFDMENDPYETNNLISDQKVAARVIRQFNPLIDAMPEHDNDPLYNKLEKSLYDTPVDKFNKNSYKKYQRHKNMSPSVTEEDFLHFKNDYP